MYQIISNFLAGIPQQPYRNGVGQYEGVVLHATDSWEDTTDGERNYEQGSWNNAFVHFFVDHTSIAQVASTDYKAWGAGPQANPRFVHIELCQSKDPNRFQEAYNRYVWLTAIILFQRKLGVSEANTDGTGTLWSHKNVTSILGGTTHEDPDDYLAYHGKTWANVINDVTYLYNCMDNPQPADDFTGHWAENAIRDVMGKGLMSGYPDGLFKPDQPVTRAELAAVLTRLK